MTTSVITRFSPFHSILSEIGEVGSTGSIFELGISERGIVGFRGFLSLWGRSDQQGGGIRQIGVEKLEFERGTLSAIEGEISSETSSQYYLNYILRFIFKRMIWRKSSALQDQHSRVCRSFQFRRQTFCIDGRNTESEDAGAETENKVNPCTSFAGGCFH